MIYHVSLEQNLFDNEVCTYISVEESLRLIASFEKKIIQFDTETTGTDPHIDKCLLAQFGNIDKSIQVTVDCTTVDLTLYKNLLETYFIIGQNLKFDCQVLYNYGIVIRRCWDTMIAEQLLYLGFPHFMIGASEDIIMEYCKVTNACDAWEDMNAKEHKAYLQWKCPEVAEFIEEHSGVSLKALCYRYLNYNMSKEVRGQINYLGPNNLSVIQYGAGDVTLLYDIALLQIERLKEKDLMKAVKVENDFVPVVAYYEYCGIHMNESLWSQKMQQDETKMNTSLTALNQFVVNYGDPRFYKVNLQGDLFGFDLDNPSSGFDSEPKCTINWNSPKQVIPFLTTLGFNCRGIDKKTKEEKDSLDATVLAPQRDVNPEFYDIYLEYSEAHKVCSTYGQNYLNAINPNTNRLHTVFRQLGTDTGRLACGSQKQNISLAKLKGLPHSSDTAPKDPKLKCAYPQMQNLPADEMTRASFCAEEGNAWISVDYCGQESVLMADFSQDKAMLNVFLKGEDMHSTVAYMIYPEFIPRDMPIKDIKNFSKESKHNGGIDYRQEAKGPEFCFAYAGNDSTLVAQYGMDPDVAKGIYDNYMNGFPGISEFQSKQKKFVVENGYILISPVTGHKAFWWDWKYWKSVQKEFNAPGFWEDYKNNHKGTGDHIAKKVKTHFKASTKWQKNACNSPFQGSGAIIFKLFNRQLFDWVVDNNYFNIVKFCVPVHDEINAESPEEIKQLVADKIQEIMKDAAKPFLKTLELNSDASISDHWIH